jgi:hypothetical protein
MHMRHRCAATPAIIGLAMALTLAACGGDDGGGESSGTTVTKAATQAGDGDGSTTTAAKADGGGSSTTAAPANRKIGKTGWYGGFAITVDDVEAQAGFGNSVELTANFTYQNLGNQQANPPEASIEVDGEVVDGLADTPAIPGAGKAKGTVTFTVEGERGKAAPTFDQAMDKVTLVYGDAGDNQTKIPLAASGKVESVEPKKLTTSGKLVQGQINVEVTGGALGPSYESGEKGKALLDLRIKLSCAADCQASGYNTDRSQFSITAPDGTSVVADDRSQYCCDALYPGTVSDDERNVLTFVVKMPGTGNYKLTYNNQSLSSSGTPAATFDFTA